MKHTDRMNPKKQKQQQQSQCISYIKKLPSNLIPREKAKLFGISSLTDIELLALFVRVGTTSDVLTLCTKILSKFNGIIGLSRATQNDLMEIEGIGAAKSIELLALFEFANRFYSKESKVITNDKEASMIAHSLVEDFNKESFIILLVDNKNKVILKKVLYSGTSSQVLIEPKDILSITLKYDAYGLYCFHNHPSGIPNPSEADLSITRRISHYCSLFGIEFKGHMILTKDKSYFRVRI